MNDDTIKNELENGEENGANEAYGENEGSDVSDVTEETRDEAQETAQTDNGDDKRAKKEKIKKKVGKEILDWVLSFVAAVVVVVILRSFFFSIIKVDGSSMVDTLHDGERLYVSVLTNKINGTERGDVVICNYPNRKTKLLGIYEYDTYFVKRVVAVPGDSVYRLNGVTYVRYTDETGSTVEEAIDPKVAGRNVQDDYEPYLLGENEYFVCGDNRYNSNDSRNWRDSTPYNDVGPITENMIVGKVRCVLWPLTKIRTVK